MTAPHNDVFDRLGAALEEWGSQIVASHDELAHRLESARIELERAIAARAEAPPSPQPGDLDALNLALETQDREVARLNAESEELHQTLADRDAQIERMQSEIASLREALAEAAQVAGESADPEELAALRAERDAANAALERLRAEHAPAREPDAQHAGIAAFDTAGHKKRMGQILLELGILSEPQLDELLDLQASHPHRRFGSLVVEHGYTSEDVVARILAAQLHLPFVQLTPDYVQPDAPQTISTHVARHHRCIPVAADKSRVVVAMANPMDLIAIEDLELASRRRVEPVVATPADIAAALDRYYGAAG